MPWRYLVFALAFALVTAMTCGGESQPDPGAPGSGGEGEPLIGSGGQSVGSGPCAPGLLCASSQGIAACAAFCDTDADCTGAGSLCIVSLETSSGSPITDARVCTASCDPTTASGCPAGIGSCQLAKESDGAGRAYTYCAAAGAGEQDAPCAAPTDCAPTFGCFTIGDVASCLKYCDAADSACPAGAACNAIQIDNDDVVVANVHYGACVTP